MSRFENTEPKSKKEIFEMAEALGSVLILSEDDKRPKVKRMRRKIQYKLQTLLWVLNVRDKV